MAPPLARLRQAIARRPLAAALGACVAVGCLPLLATRLLPFHDAPGLIGLVGALARVDDPAARIDAFYEVDFGPYPSVFYFAWGWALAKAGVPVDLAFSLFLALFCLAGPPLALVAVLRAHGRPAALGLLAVPVMWHHQIWFGFLGSAAAITFLLLAVAFARRMVDAPTPRAAAGLALSLLAVATAHPFSFALALAMVAPVLFWPAGGLAATARRLPLRLAAFVPSLAFLGAWAARFFDGGGGPGPSLVARVGRELSAADPRFPDDLWLFVRWLGDGYRGSWDEVVPLLGVATLVPFAVLGVRGEGVRGEDRTPRRRWPLLAWGLGVLALGYLLLPNRVFWPTNWWGVRVRCVVPLYLLAVAAVRPRPRGLPPWALAPAAGAGVAFALFVTVDFRTHWEGRVLPGFRRAIAAIPAGESVLAMPVLPDPHYTQPHPYLAQHYVVRAGGRVVPFLGGHPGSYWITARPAPPAPAWGKPAEFVWAEHAPGYDWFLVEVPPGGPAPRPFDGAPAGAVDLVVAEGQWRLYRRRGAVP